MNTGMNALLRCCCLVAAGLGLGLASGCASLRPEATPATPGFYSLDMARGSAQGLSAVANPVSATAPALVVSVPRAVAGFDSKRIIYQRQPHKLEYFAHGEWIDTPARMLSPLIVAALESSGTFRAVVHAPGSASGELRLDSEVVLLQHEFDGTPSHVRFVLRASLVEDASRRIIATREFEAVVNAASEDTYGGVLAANRAVQEVLEKLTAFCTEGAQSWQLGKLQKKPSY